LANMIQVSLVAYAGAGALLPMPYFDLFYQLLAVTAVLNVLLERAARGIVDHSMVSPGENDEQAAPVKPRRRRSRSLASNGSTRKGKPSSTSNGSTQDLPWW